MHAVLVVNTCLYCIYSQYLNTYQLIKMLNVQKIRNECGRNCCSFSWPL